MRESTLKIGWASTDITPDQPVLIAGQFHARVSEGVKDPVTATALAMESTADGGAAILVSCDLVSIADGLRDAVRERVGAALPEVDPRSVCMSATHTHTAPCTRVADDALRQGIPNEPTRYGLPAEALGVMVPADYVAFAAERVADAAIRAWTERKPGGIGFGVGHAVVGRNRRIAYRDGSSRMYGKTNTPDFSHMEGDDDPDVNLLCTYDAEENLTGLVVNVACPSQVSEHLFEISADYWHDTRVELRRRLGEGLFVLPQCSAAGDQSPHVLIKREAEARMLALKGLTEPKTEVQGNNLGDPDALRREIADRIADAAEKALPSIQKAIDWNPKFARSVETVELPGRSLSEEDVNQALAEATEWEEKHAALRKELDENPDKKREPRWYVEISKAFSKIRWSKGVQTRFEQQKENPRVPVEVTLLRLGDMAVATNPFEYYLDFGMQIKARSPAVQTFVVQLAGTGTYVPTERAVAGKSYGAVPASTPVGPEGGQEVVEYSLGGLAEFWR